jgi:hypothetical protein
MNKDNVIAITCLLIFVLAVGSLLRVNNMHMNKLVFALTNNSKFNEGDFMIKDFGIGDDRSPYISVIGTPGGTVPDKDNIGYAYVFVTDNGTYAVSSDWMYPNWHTHQLTLDEKNCVKSMNMGVGGAEVRDTVKLTNTHQHWVRKVMTAEFTLNDSDGSICATKIFDSAP